MCPAVVLRLGGSGYGSEEQGLAHGADEGDIGSGEWGSEQEDEEGWSHNWEVGRGYFSSSRSRYWPYWFLAMGLAKSANCSLESQPLRQAISSRQAT